LVAVVDTAPSSRSTNQRRHGDVGLPPSTDRPGWNQKGCDMAPDQSETGHDPETDARRRAMNLFAIASKGDLSAGIEAVGGAPDWQYLRPPEIGLVMVRGRIGGGGAPFNLGEVTVTRCAIALQDGPVGTAYVMGRDKEKARLAAICDALWQTPAHRPRIEADLLAPVAASQADKDRTRAAETQATRVDFFTMVRGDD